jgi:hypothetical protein
VDTAGPGRKASQAGRSARNTAFVARCGRSAPPAAARDPGRPRPAAGARDGGPGDTSTERLRAATVRPQARRRRCHPDPPRRAGFASVRPAPPGSGRAANGAGNLARNPARQGSERDDQQPAPDLDRYLARHRFRPQASHSTWLDRDNGQYVIRVVRGPEEQTQLICLAPCSACVYQAVFSLGTPDAVIIAAVEAALSPACRRRPAPDRAGHGPAAHARRKAVSGDDNR